MDVLTPEQRRRNMQAIRSKDTKIEILLAKALWKKGYRYRKNNKSIIGKPDISFKGLKIAIFCDSEFWHGKDWDNQKRRIGTNKKYWDNKISKNIERDKRVNKELTENGWIVIRFWETEIKKQLNLCIQKIETAIKTRKTINS